MNSTNSSDSRTQFSKRTRCSCGSFTSGLLAKQFVVGSETRLAGTFFTILTWALVSNVWLSPVTTAQAAEPPTTNALLGSLNSSVVGAEHKTVKLYGAGGSGLDSYQSGFYISAEGHILTVWSTVLDVDNVTVVTSDGGRYESQVVGVDPNLEIAVLKTDAAPQAYFSLKDAVDATAGQRVVAISNLFGIATGNEMSSVQKGIIMAKTTLNARRGSFESVYQGPVLVIDAMTNNPGAAGGALTTLEGQLVGILGKELRDARANIWLNYAVPIGPLKQSIENIIAGKSIARNQVTRPLADRPLRLVDLGIALIPNLLPKTPAYVDLVEPNSRASDAGVMPDDLILFVNSARISSQTALLEELQHIDRADELTLLVQRGKELKEVIVSP